MISYLRDFAYFGAAYTFGLVTYRVFERSLQSSEDQKGYFFVRMKRGFCAVLMMPFTSSLYTSLHHLDSVLKLSPKDVTEDNKLEQEIRKIASLGYMQEIVQKNPSMKIPVFEYNPDLPSPADLNEKIYKFIFSGDISYLHNLKSQENILYGDYIRCHNSFYIKKETNEYRWIDTLITNTSNSNPCTELEKRIYHDAAVIAASTTPPIKIDPEEPSFKTIVFTYNKNIIKDAGDLHTLSDSVKNEIRTKNFTVCNLSWNSSAYFEDKHGVIITGTTNPEVCQKLYDLSLNYRHAYSG